MPKRQSSWTIGLVQSVETFATAVFAGEFLLFFVLFLCVFSVVIVS